MWPAVGSTQRRRPRSAGLHGFARIRGRGSARLSNSAGKTFGLRDDGVWIINITPEAGTVKDKEAREVVLHAHLAELGFGDFVRGSRPGYLFLNAVVGKDIRGVWRSIKNRLTDFARVVVTDEKVAPNHGWRHAFKTIGREAGIADSVLDAICGHAPGSIGGSYGDTSIAAQVRAFGLFPRFEP